jgi:DHA2 family multidrug resistance protein
MYTKMKGVAVMKQSIVKQSAILSHVDAFFLIGLLFALTLPLLLLVVKAPKNVADRR